MSKTLMVLSVALMGALPVAAGAAPAPASSPQMCGGAKAVMEMTMGATFKHNAPYQARSLESLAAIVDKHRMLQGWLALDDRGDAWVQLSSASSQSVRRQLKLRPPKSGEQAFSYFGNANKLPPALRLLTCRRFEKNRD